MQRVAFKKCIFWISVVNGISTTISIQIIVFKKNQMSIKKNIEILCVNVLYISSKQKNAKQKNINPTVV